MSLALLPLLCTCVPAPKNAREPEKRLEKVCSEIVYASGLLDVSGCVFGSPKRVPPHRNWRFHRQALPNQIAGTVAPAGDSLTLLHYRNYLDEADHEPITKY